VAEVKRRKGESFEGLLRRFNRRVMESGRMFSARKNRFHKKEATPNSEKRSTLRRLRIRANREWLLKTGRLVEDPMKKHGNGMRR
jgi:ribosomal protein S21